MRRTAEDERGRAHLHARAAATLPGAVRWRFDRQLHYLAEAAQHGAFATVDPERWQSVLAGTTVVVAGTGGLGATIASALAAVGVGRLVLCDFDVVSEDDLPGQVWYRPDDTGRPKVEALGLFLADRNPDTSIEMRDACIAAHADLDVVVPDGALVVGCASAPAGDAFARLLSEVCVPRDITHLVGCGYAGSGGSTGMLVVPRETACWVCDQESGRIDLVAEDAAPSAVLEGVVAMLPSIVGNLVAWDLFRSILGEPSLLAGRTGELDFRTLELRWRDVERRADCRLCGDDTIVVTSPTTR